MNKLNITILSLLVTLTLPCQASDKVYPTGAIVYQLYEPLSASCDANDLKLTKYNQQICNKKKKKALLKCQKLIVSDKPENIPPQEIRVLMGRMLLCNTNLLLGTEYSNKKADLMVKEMFHDKHNKTANKRVK